MDRNLRIRMLLEAGDKVSRPLRNIATGSGRAARELRNTRDQLARLQRTQADISSFRTLKNDLHGTEQQLAAARTRVGELARQMRAAENPSRRLARDFEAAKRAAAALKTQHDDQGRALQQLRGRLREAGIGTNRLTQHERELRQATDHANRELAEQSRRLQHASDRARRYAAARDRFGTVQGTATGLAASGFSAIETGRAMAGPLVGAVQAAQQFETGMTDVAQKADLTRAQAAKMGDTLLAAARAANQLPESLQAGVDVLSGFGLDPTKAVQMIAPIGRAATAYRAEIADLAAASFANLDNLKVPIDQTARAIDIMAQAGKAGAFEMKDMAQYFPTLTAGYQALGQSGVGAVADLSAALQIARKGAGDSATAATNVANILQKITSPATVRAFAKMGVDLPKALKRAYAEGKTPLEAIAELTNKALGGDMSRLGNLFEDAQVQQGLRPLIANMEEYRRIRSEAMAAGGTTDRDFAERMKDSAEQTNRLKTNAATLAIGLGTKLLPAVNAVLARANAFTDRLMKWTAAHPGLTKSVLLGAAAFAALFLVLGGGAIVLAGLAAPFAALAAVSTALGIGILPLAGIVLGVVAAVVALGAAAYAIYANWGRIGAWFSNLWQGIKSATWSAIQFVTRILLNFTPQGLLVKGFMALLAWMRGPLGQRMIAAGGDIVRGIITGITGMLGRLKDTIVGAASAAANWFKGKLGIHSPSRLFASFGGFMMQGLDRGIAGDQDLPVDRIDGLASRLAGAVATGTAALAVGAASASPGPSPRAAAVTIGPVTIVIKQQAGQSDRDLARAVRAELEELMRTGAGAGRRASMADRPDGDDL
ncbi:phage tail tape measure protein [Sphingomonas sp. RS6]